MAKDRIEQTLLKLKDEALEATRQGDTEFYRGYLSDDATAVTPAGVFRKDGILRAIGSGAFRSVAIENTETRELGSDAGMVTYVATFERPDKSRIQMFVTTVYLRTDGAWKGVFYQQTQMPK